MRKYIAFVLTSFILNSCNSLNINQFEDILQVNNSNNNIKKDNINQKIVLDNPAFYNSGTELSVFAVLDDKKIIKYQTKKSGSSVMAITTIYKSKWVELEVRNTTAMDADTVLKLVRQGGYAKEYAILYERYSILGLVN
jgi:hypothetical protein